MIKGSAIILLFLLLGNLASWIVDGFLPGSVCGMLLLFAALKLRVIRADDVKGVAKALTDNMALFFVPIGVGVMAEYDLISSNLAVFIIVPIATTALVVVVVGVMQQYLEQRRDGSNN